MRFSPFIRWLLPAVMIVSLTSGCAILEFREGPLPTAAVVATVPPTSTSKPTTPAVPTVKSTAIPEPPPTGIPPTFEPSPEATTRPPLEASAPALPAVVEYDLGAGAIIQDWFPEDSRFREMPIRLNGIIAVPEGEPQPSPVVVILHGTHPGCPTGPDGMVDTWPCAPEVEQPNYRGFDYLEKHLAANGYVALSLNINAVNTFGFGEANGEQVGVRLEQLVDQHLAALATAASGGENNFSVALDGRADMGRLAFVGHSRGGEYANWLARETGVNSPYSLAHRGYGPVAGVLHLAPAVSVFQPTPSGVPQAIILPACDADVVNQDGQAYFEEVRQDVTAAEWATSAWLEGANHNSFNSILGGDLFGLPDRPDCNKIVAPDKQRGVTEQYATDFLMTLFGSDPDAILDAQERLGLDVTLEAPDAFYGLPGRVSSLSAVDDRLTLLVPSDAAELATNRLGGVVVAENVRTTFCPPGFFLPQDIPGTEACRRFDAVVPGNPAFVVASWEGPGAALRLAIPPGAGDLSGYRALSLRAVLDPLSSLNAAATPQAITVRLTDTSGATSSLTTRAAEPALQYPIGVIVDDPLSGQIFSGRLPLTTVRLSLRDFADVDLSAISEIALLFDQTPSGTLFLGDIELVRPPPIIGASSTLLENADGAYDALKGVVRFNGISACTGVLLNTGDHPDAPAYLLTNGHCVQDWEANAVYVDMPVDGWSATFNYFVDTADARLTVPASRVAYSTMKGRDVAVVELATTTGELATLGIAPFELAGTIPDGSWPLTVVGAPAQGVPAELAYLRAEDCLASGRTDLFELIWHFDAAIRSSCRDILGSSSGSPVFVTGTDDVVGLINTTTVGALTPCGLGAPCESTPAGTTLVPDRSYATPVNGLDACFDADGKFDLGAESCPLDDGRQLLVSGAPSQGIQPPATWDVTVTGELPYYLYKTGAVGQVDCRKDEGYGPVIALDDADRIDDPLPPDEGSYLLCVLAGETSAVDATWQLPENATKARALVDTTPPSVEPVLNVTHLADGGLLFEPVFAVAELVDYRLKFGPEAEIDCSAEEDFAPYRRVPLRIEAAQLPASVCLIGYDYAGNASRPHEIVLGRP